MVVLGLQARMWFVPALWWRDRAVYRFFMVLIFTARVFYSLLSRQATEKLVFMLLLQKSDIKIFMQLTFFFVCIRIQKGLYEQTDSRKKGIYLHLTCLLNTFNSSY